MIARGAGMRFTVLSVVAILSSGAFGAEPKEIPLKDIWANRVPGTRDINKLDKQPSMVLDIRRAIGFPTKDKAKPGFAVEGTGPDALREAHAVFVKDKKPRDTFSGRDEVSVVFFAYETRPYVHLQKVELQGNNINVYYQFVYHETEEVTRYIALIPLGKLPAGKYRVNINRSPKEKYGGSQPLSDEIAARIVCRSFSFTVSDKEASHEPIENSE